MSAITSWMLAVSLSLTPALTVETPRRIDVDCAIEGALDKALATAAQAGAMDIYLHGVCKGHFVVASDDVTLRGATPESGLLAPEGDFGFTPVLEIDDVRGAVRDLSVRGGEIGVFVHGSDADALLAHVDLHQQSGVGVYAERGAELHVFDSTIHDGEIGILASDNSTLNVQRGIVGDCDTGVVVFDRSTAAISDTMIQDNRVGGLNVTGRSDANLSGDVFRENTQVHVNANDWSSIILSNGTTLGSDTDSTSYALSATRGGTLTSYSTPFIHGDVGLLYGASARLGNTVLDGNLVLSIFATAHVRNSEISGTVFCSDGAEAICPNTTTGGSSGCPSSTCGPPIPAAVERPKPAPEPPVIEPPRFEAPSTPLSRPRSRPRR